MGFTIFCCALKPSGFLNKLKLFSLLLLLAVEGKLKGEGDDSELDDDEVEDVNEAGEEGGEEEEDVSRETTFVFAGGEGANKLLN